MRTAVRRIGIGIAAGLPVLALTATLAVGWAWRALTEPIDVPAEGLFFEIESGAALSTVTARLARRGAVDRPWLLNWYGRLRGDATRIKAGEYRLDGRLSAVDLLDKLSAGEVYLHQFTIIEGWRFENMLAALRAHAAVDAGTTTGEEIMAALGKPDAHPEGQFLPDTYTFPRGTADIELLRWAHEALWEEVEAAWRESEASPPLASAYEGLILASIIEKETALESERGLISGVFHERLERGMRLQTDPTVIYGLGETFDGNLRRADLEADTPYNTYTRAGLPPTPIALAGRDAIAAAFAPVSNGALYFVATGEPDGSHAFSHTLEEHNAAVSLYLERRRGGQP
jgi:UPF0755 protein